MCRKLIYLFSFVSLLNLVVTNVAQAAAPSTLACYTFDDGTAVNVGGSAGSAADGTLQGGASIIYDAGGNGKKESYVLDITGSPQYVNCGGGNGGWADIPQSELTIAAWYKAREIPPDNFMSIACKGDGETGVGGYSLSSHSRSANVTFTCMSVGGWEGLESTNLNAWDDQWHHVAGVYISGVGAEIYVDGVLSDSASTGATGINLNQWDFIIGGNGEEIGLSTGWRHFNGLIDDVCVFDQALSVAEIQQIMEGIGVSTRTKASDPYPADEQTDVPRDVVLSWTQGEYAPLVNGHKVYLSENFNDANDATDGITQPRQRGYLRQQDFRLR